MEKNKKCFCRINARLLPIKLHYFLMLAAFAASLSYKTLVGKEIGFPAVSVGFILTTSTFINLLSTPLFGFVSDLFRLMKWFCLSLLLAMALAAFGIAVIPPLNNSNSTISQGTNLKRITRRDLSNYSKTDVHEHFNRSNNQSIIFSNTWSPIVDSKTNLYENLNNNLSVLDFTVWSHDNKTNFNQHINITVEQRVPSSSSPIYTDDSESKLLQNMYNVSVKSVIFLPISENIDNNTDTMYQELKELNIQTIKPYLVESHLEFDVHDQISLNTSVYATVEESEDLFDGHPDNIDNAEKPSTQSLHDKYQFWVFLLLSIIICTSSANAISLSDTICCDILQGQRHLYGQQRVWGAVGVAFGVFSAGYLNDFFKSKSENKSFSYVPGYTLTLIIIIVDALLLSTFPNTKPKPRVGLYKGLKLILRSKSIIFYALGAMIVGALIANVKSFVFWYIHDLGGSQTLIGSSVALQCLLSEVPCFLVSGWLVAKIGYFSALVLVFVSFSIRFTLYSIIWNPWWVLLIDMLHGIGFSLFHASMTSFASENAPEGLEATTIGTFNGLISGLGHGIGTILGGAGIDVFGCRRMFAIAGASSFILAIVFAIIFTIIAKSRSDKERDPNL